MQNIFKDKYTQRSWADIAYDFVDIVKGRINKALIEQEIKFFKKLGGIVLLLIGAVFFLSGFSIFLGQLINDTSWSGYLIVGGALLIVGGVFLKK